MRIRRAAESVSYGIPNTNSDFARRVTIGILAALVAALGWATYVFSAPAFQGAPGVTVTPSELYTGDSIEITLDGLPAGYLIPGVP